MAAVLEMLSIYPVADVAAPVDDKLNRFPVVIAVEEEAIDKALPDVRALAVIAASVPLVAELAVILNNPAVPVYAPEAVIPNAVPVVVASVIPTPLPVCAPEKLKFANPLVAAPADAEET